MTFEHITKETYDEIAKHFATKRTYNWPPVKEFLQKFSNKNDLTLLDLGCGGGRTLELANSLGFNLNNLLGVDYSEGQLKVTRKKGFIVKKNNMLDLSFADNSFDIITCIATLHHLLNKKDQLLALKEMKRVLKGKIILCNWLPQKEYLIEQIKKKKFQFVGVDSCFNETEFNSQFNSSECDVKEKSDHKFNEKVVKVSYKTNSKKFDRYYYLFSKPEIIDLCKLAGFNILHKEQFKGNFYLIMN